MCNLYSLTRGQQAIREWPARCSIAPATCRRCRAFFQTMLRDRAQRSRRAELVLARWGMPSSRKAILTRPVPGRTSSAPDACCAWSRRERASAHWKRWRQSADAIGAVHVVFRVQPRCWRHIWFALNGSPLAFFAGITAAGWTSVRKVRRNANDLFAFLTTEPNADVEPVHPKAMPVILTTPAEIEQWMTAPVAEALGLQRPLPDGALRIVARGGKKDGGDVVDPSRSYGYFASSRRAAAIAAARASSASRRSANTPWSGGSVDVADTDFLACQRHGASLPRQT